MTASSITSGNIEFFDNYQPSIEDGKYTIQSEANIDGVDTGNYFDKPIEQEFEVRGPQFSLASSEIHSVYPPAQSNSIYGQFLSNIVLNRRVLPWERRMDPNNSTVPWLCLLAFREDEIPQGSVVNSTTRSATVSAFLASNPDVVKPALETADIDAAVLASTCNYIQITATNFQALAPKVTELSYLNHVRQVDVADQAFMETDEQGWFAVATGNRLLDVTGGRGTRYFVHLVSVEGYFDLMSDPGTWPKKQSDPNELKDIALVSLFDWTFLSQPQKLDFRELVENFASQTDGDPEKLFLRRNVVAPDNPPPEMQKTLTRLNQGYVPRSFHTASGEDTYAWYRGPLTPVTAQPLPRPDSNYHYPSASAAMIYDTDDGVFDQSYAAAWSIGRAMALADGNFSQALVRFRRASYQLLGRLIDRLKAADEASQADLTEVAHSSVVLDAFRKALQADINSTVQATSLIGNMTLANQRAKALAGDPVATAQAFLEEPAVMEFLAEETEAELAPLAQWLARQRLLYDVPFDHLVPDQSALPVESLRVFTLDSNWLDSLVDGALSIGIHSSKDSFYTQSMRGVIENAIAIEAQKIRANLLKRPLTSELKRTLGEISGVLIRSAVVSGWPGLEIKAFLGGFATGTALEVLRMDRLAPNVLFALFDGVPDHLIVAEPQQGLCFGVQDGNVVALRQLSDPPGKPLGKDMPAVFRTASGGIGDTVLNVNDGPAAMVPTMASAAFLGASVGPAQFGMEMVKSPEMISFQTNAAQGKQP